ncbi:hypothetical protein [Legionella fallonii]|uniref:Ubiquinone biosynthesis accessory factor UbiJ n=1 Tax=Legionella fallonii LLAP-10 TaxID=1212491 RepID=A0A098GAF9_9GAMM|nr:hypothetical protein [Legionella fallonii]CEG58967.1 protein of unknown function [Legionella fallonii LLAP-10]
MNPIKRLIRVISINAFLAKYTLKSALLLLKLFSPLQVVKWLNPKRWFRKKTTLPHESPQLSLNDFKPLLATLGSVLSTRQAIQSNGIKQKFDRFKNKMTPVINPETEIITEASNEPFFSEVEMNTNKTEDLSSHIKKLWNELNLPQFTGDGIGQQIGSLVNKGKEFKKQVADSLQLNIVEYIQEELRVYPSRDELNDFFNEIDELSLSVGRLQAHVNQLMSSHEIN